jgi:hypothetical protein
MKIHLIGLFFFWSLFGFSQSNYDTSKAFQDKMDSEYADSSHSPLKTEDRLKFEGLPYFPIDTNFIVTATLIRISDEETFEMKTTTDRLPLYTPYYKATFKLDSTMVSLTIYQSEDIKSREGYEDYLFLPFTDATNGNETYGGGRYIDLKIVEGDSISIDFNSAYNPYCAYNKKYSCPIPPRENDINIPIKAGVKYVSKD